MREGCGVRLSTKKPPGSRVSDLAGMLVVLGLTDESRVISVGDASYVLWAINGV